MFLLGIVSTRSSNLQDDPDREEDWPHGEGSTGYRGVVPNAVCNDDAFVTNRNFQRINEGKNIWFAFFISEHVENSLPKSFKHARNLVIQDTQSLITTLNNVARVGRSCEKAGC